MKNQLLILISLLLGFVNLQGQVDQAQLPQRSIGVGYFGEFLNHPGFVLSYDHSVAKFPTDNQLLIRMNAIYYWHKTNKHNFLIFPELVYREVGSSGFYGDLIGGIGWINRNPAENSTTYRSSQRERNSWHYLTASFGVAVGKIQTLNNGNLLLASIGVKGIYQYPFKEAWIISPILFAQVHYQLK